MIMYLFVIEIIIIENVFEDGLICINQIFIKNFIFYFDTIKIKCNFTKLVFNCDRYVNV